MSVTQLLADLTVGRWVGQDAELSHQEARAGKLRLEVQYWESEHDNLQVDVKVRRSDRQHAQQQSRATATAARKSL